MNEQNYYELHIPSIRNGEEYDFDFNYKILEETVEDLRGLVKSNKPRMDRNVAERFIQWISNINPEKDYKLDEFRHSLGSYQIEQFNKSFMNRLDPVTLMVEDAFFCHYCQKDDSIRKSGRQPDYIFSLNSIMEPVWK